MSKLAEWARDALIRAIKTAAQAAIAAIPVSAITFSEVSWATVGGVALLAFVLSWITSLAGIPEACDGENIIEIIEGEDDPIEEPGEAWNEEIEENDEIEDNDEIDDDEGGDDDE